MPTGNAMKLEGSVALVTGAAKRVGRAIALALADDGCDVAIHYHRSVDEADELRAMVIQRGRRALTVAGDLADPDCWSAIVERTAGELGRLDILINNASLYQTETPDTLDGFDHVQWERMLRTNLVAPMALCHAASRHLAASGRGHIVNLCDIAAERPWPAHLAYCVSKAGLVCLTKVLARAMAPHVRVNGVAPGIAVFPDEYSEETRQRLTRPVPLEREGTPEEVADLVRFLVSRGDYITGQVLDIDGGRGLV